MAKSKGKCSEKPRRRGPMTVKVNSYYRKNKTLVRSHRRHKPRISKASPPPPPPRKGKR